MPVRKTAPTDIKLLSTQHLVDEFKETERKMAETLKTGKPHIYWLREFEDDSRIRFPSRDFKDGIPTLNQTLGHMTSGTMVLAGRANAGKTTAAISMMVGNLSLNDDVLVVDVSLDDPRKKRLVQFTANLSGVRYTEITSVADLSEYKSDMVSDARRKFFRWLEEGRLISVQPKEGLSDGRKISIRDYKTIVYLMRHLRQSYPGVKIVMYVDAWNNLDKSSASSRGDLEQQNEMLAELKEESEEQEICLVVTAHFKKTKEAPGIQDIKGTSDMEYNVVAGLIVRNEYRENPLGDPLMYTDDSGYEYPILTTEVAKTKIGDWDKPLMHVLRADICRIEPLSPGEYMDYFSEFRGKRR